MESFEKSIRSQLRSDFSGSEPENASPKTRVEVRKDSASKSREQVGTPMDTMEEIPDNVSVHSVKSTHKADAVRRLAVNKFKSVTSAVQPQLEQMGIAEPEKVVTNPGLRRHTFIGAGKKKFAEESEDSERSVKQVEE